MISDIKCRRGTRSVDMEFMEMTGFCREAIGGERRMILHGVFNEQTWKLENQLIMSEHVGLYARQLGKKGG